MLTKSKRDLAFYLLTNTAYAYIVYSGSILGVKSAFNVVIFLTVLAAIEKSLVIVVRKVKNFKELKDKPSIKYKSLTDLFNAATVIFLVIPGNFLLAALAAWSWAVTDWARDKALED